ncbi:MAG: hypothetical protein R2932_21840 [Caldilineaceae bacterium]
MITTLILMFFGASCLASIVVFAACAASARADEMQRQAFAGYFEENEVTIVERRQKITAGGRLALNP